MPGVPSQPNRILVRRLSLQNPKGVVAPSQLPKTPVHHLPGESIGLTPRKDGPASLTIQEDLETLRLRRQHAKASKSLFTILKNQNCWPKNLPKPSGQVFDSLRFSPHGGIIGRSGTLPSETTSKAQLLAYDKFSVTSRDSSMHKLDVSEVLKLPSGANKIATDLATCKVIDACIKATQNELKNVSVVSDAGNLWQRHHDLLRGQQTLFLAERPHLKMPESLSLNA